MIVARNKKALFLSQERNGNFQSQLVSRHRLTKRVWIHQLYLPNSEDVAQKVSLSAKKLNLLRMIVTVKRTKIKLVDVKSINVDQETMKIMNNDTYSQSI